ncbi:AAA family ATPase [Anaerosphaera multitolerans]|uniref:Serine/threonine protein kinase n=1 Tax=Anaerosphaera multitolerans TaxID=2487351 RepID=A0A437S9Q7_9FIRM|nr:AAA family ATPase [Anaerosphaera multitolerans]RVU55611.1 serine/threonine protein kinase [Anaerosphaera multitolerans]
MVDINCNLFNSVVIKEDDNEVLIPGGKVGGVFYYILMKKIVSRDELAGIFWPSSNEENAKLSLRNAIHKIRKSFKEDIIISPNKSTLMLNEDINFIIDADIFDKDPFKNLDLYKGEFLKGFYIKDTIEFEYWLIEMRNYYKERCIITLQERIKVDYQERELTQLEKDINTLLRIDNFNDFAYLYLLKLYKLKGRNDKIINEYYNIQRILRDELGIDPTEEMTAIYKEAVESVGNKKVKNLKEDNTLFYNREFEMDLIQKNLDKFYSGETSKSILVSGEVGMGKTLLKKNILKQNKGKFKVFEVSCYSVEKEFSYSPWIKIIDLINKELSKEDSEKPILWDDVIKKLFFDGSNKTQGVRKILENKENYDSDLIYNSIISALKSLSKKGKVLIVIEDIQWADTLSMKILVNLILHVNEDVRFFLTKTNEVSKNIDRHLTTLIDLNKLLEIKLNRFDKTTVGVILRKEINDISEADIDYIYERSKGNALFLKVYIDIFKNNKKEDLITSKVSDILQETFSNLSDTEMKILEVISAFYGSIDIELLLKIVDIKAFEIVDNLNNLVKKNILEENKSGKSVIITFVHSVYKDFVYGELNDLSKQIIHREIAEALEGELSEDNKDITKFIKLKYHYNRANEEVKTVKYEVYILNYYLNFNHEVFPNLDDYDLNRQVKNFINNDRAMQWLDEIECNILKIKNSSKNSSNINEINSIELLFLYCKGRYLIRCGNYSSGVKVMNRVIQMGNELKDERMELSGHKQMAIYAIQINEPEIMLKHIIEAIKVARSLKDNVEIGVLYRLYGVYYMMKGNFKQAELLFEKSVDTFNALEFISNYNSISIAADYNYIGEIRNAEGNYEKAMQYYGKAINLCKGVEVTCQALFYLNAGKTSYLMGNFADMEKYLNLAKSIVKQFDSYWKNSILDAFLALCNFIKGNYQIALEYLKDAIAEVKTINNPRDIGSVYFVQTIIALELEERAEKELDDFKGFLKESSEYYYYNALRYLEEYRDRSEIEFLKSLIQNDFNEVII